ncbi:MAG: hypothetical protein HOI35_11830 [Woeseia sp.]|jgi:hypothetical protein|nr:hypothetical protein [Woeseia sp.]MBT6210696.1 hypothetical protein [Woeseia sp.]
MSTSTQHWYQLLGQIGRWLPLRTYGELVLRPVTIADRAANAEIAFSTADNKK